MIEDKRHQLDGLKLSDILSYCGCRAFTTEEYIRGANKQIANLEKENTELKEKLEYAKTIIQDLLNNSDEYARQRAMDFLKEAEE